MKCILVEFSAGVEMNMTYLYFNRKRCNTKTSAGVDTVSKEYF